MTKCRVDDCERTRSIKGLCALHYQRVQKTGDVGPAWRLTVRGAGLETACLFDGCGRTTEAKGFCSNHYRLVRRAGKYGLSSDDLQRMRSGPCAVCGQPKGAAEFVLDHDHRTGLARGLIHPRCNVLVGYLESCGLPLVWDALEYIKHGYHWREVISEPIPDGDLVVR
jgi:hypothetical protein